MKKLKARIIYKLTAISLFVTAFATGSTGLVFADKIAEAAEGAATGFQGSAQGMVKWLLVIVMVLAGIVFLIGSQRAKEHQKETAWEKLVGIALIICAVPIAGLILGWF